MIIRTASEALRADADSQLDATIIATRLTLALHNLDEAKSGFRTGHDAPYDAEGGSRTEQLALTPDKARNAEHRLFFLLANRTVLERELASIVNTWGWTPAVPPPAKKGQAKGEDGTHSEGLCRNHLAYGYRIDARPGHGSLCDWCASVKAVYDALPNASLIEARRNGVKKRLQQPDYERHLGVKRKKKRIRR